MSIPRALLFATALLIVSTSALAQTKTVWSNIDDYPICPSGVYKQCWQMSSSLAGGSTTATLSGPTPTASPSLDGSSAQFSIGQNSGYANGLWWANTICCVAGVSSGYFNFEYDLYFYIPNPSLSQALEFDVNQTISNQSAGTSVRYVFGTQCNNLATGDWQVWDQGVGWYNTHVKCSMPAMQWNHIIWEFQRTSGGKVNFISLTFNGHKYYINKKFGPRQLNALADDLNVAFQMDSDSKGDAYSTFLDEIKLTAW